MRNFNSFVRAPFNFQLKPDYQIRGTGYPFLSPTASELCTGTAKFHTTQEHSAPVASLKQTQSIEKTIGVPS